MPTFLWYMYIFNELINVHPTYYTSATAGPYVAGILLISSVVNNTWKGINYLTMSIFHFQLCASIVVTDCVFGLKVSQISCFIVFLIIV